MAMRYGNVAGIGKAVSRLVQGTVFLDHEHIDRTLEFLDRLYEMGCNTFDTAHIYANGMCERTIGRWVNERGIREKVVIIGKGAHFNADRERVTPFDITSDLYDSLARFKFDYVDLYLLHRDDPKVPVGPIVEVLNEHHRAGRIRAFGGSNWTHDRVREANEYAVSKGLVPFTASSPHFSLAEQVVPTWRGAVTLTGAQNEAARQWYVRNQMAVLAWATMAGGFFSDKYRRDNIETIEDGYIRASIKSYVSDENFARLDRTRELGRQKGVTPAQVAMAYVFAQPMNLFALAASRSVDEFAQNLGAMEVRLSPEEIRWLAGAEEKAATAVERPAAC